MRFPALTARDLEGRDYTLPDDLPRGPRVILLPFQRWHQTLVDEWSRGLTRARESRPDLTVWEVPALSALYRPGRFYIDGGMRAGIPSVDTRRHTLTAYTDLGSLGAALELPSFETVYAFLLDTDGEIVWRGSGPADAEQIGALETALAALPG